LSASLAHGFGESEASQEAREFLSDLPAIWRMSGPQERTRLVHSLFERIEVMGVEEVRIFPTQEALDHGWFEVWNGETLRVPLGAASLRYDPKDRAWSGREE
jgi:hypothetical protein